MFALIALGAPAVMLFAVWYMFPGFFPTFMPQLQHALRSGPAADAVALLHEALACLGIPGPYPDGVTIVIFLTSTLAGLCTFL